MMSINVSVNSSWVRTSSPWGLAQKTCSGAQDLSFESCWGVGNWTRARTLWKMKMKLQSMDQIFTGENKRAKKIYVFFQWNFSWYMGQFFDSAVTHTLQNLRSCPWLVYLKFSVSYVYL